MDPDLPPDSEPPSDPGPRGEPADDGPEEQTWTAAAHASHFLQRALRCRGEDLERAMAMYHHSVLMRRLIPELLSDQPEVTRAAIPLRDEPPAPHVVVTRDGRFVTCLDEDMAHDLPVLPRATIAERIAEEDAARGRLQRSRVQLRRLRSVALIKALIAGYGHVTREMVEIVLMEPTTYLAGTLQVFSDTYARWVRLCAGRPFAQNPTAVYRRQLEAEATCRLALPLLGAMDAQLLTEYLELFLQTNSTLEIEIISALSRHSGGGEALLRAALEPRVAEATRKLCASYVGTHFLYHPARAAALLPRARALPQLELDSEFMKSLREIYDGWLALSEEDLLACLEREGRKELDHLPPVARRYRLTSDDYYRTLHRQFSVTLLYPPSAVAGGMRQSWARHLRDVRPPPRTRTGVRPVRNEAPKVGRNDPCPCHSGRKHKQCCLLQPRGVEAPPPAPSEPAATLAQAQAETAAPPAP